MAIVATLVSSCAGGGAAAQQASSTPSATPSATATRESPHTFRILASDACLNLTTVRQVLAEMPSYRTLKDRATGIRTIVDVLDTTYRDARVLVPSAPRNMEAQYRQSMVKPLHRMTAFLNSALRDYHAGRYNAGFAAVDRFEHAAVPFVAYAKKHHLDQCIL